MRDHLVFYVNGRRQTAGAEQALLTLTEYLRRACRLTGTKVACAEGDCGACSVLIGRPSADASRLEYQSIDACIALVCQLDQTHIITTEALQDPEGLSQVQRQMVDCHGSQCGYCTPGFVAAMHGIVEESRDAEALDEETLRLGLSGNLCRCTGYAQILEAGLGIDLASTTRMADRFDEQEMLKDFGALGPEGVRLETPTEANGSPASVLRVAVPASLDQALQLKNERPDLTVVAGATDLGVQRNHGKISPTDVMTTKGIAEMDRLEIEEGELIIGAAVSWSRIEAFVEDRLPEYHAVLTRFGSPQIRHAGTLAGNLANASPIADSIPMHMVCDTTLELASVRGVRTVSLNEFYLGYKKLDLAADELIVTIRTPLPTEDQQLKLYKISKRRDLDISTVTAAFLLTLDGDTITDARVALGGVGPVVHRTPKAEQRLMGATLGEESLREAGEIAVKEVAPISDVRGSDRYRLQLVQNLFVKCYHDLAQPAGAV